MRALKGIPGIKVGGYNMNNIIYADDTVLIADNENELQEMLDTVVREIEKKCLSLNKKKTEVMVISKKNGIVRDLRDFWFNFFQKRENWHTCPQ